MTGARIRIAFAGPSNSSLDSTVTDHRPAVSHLITRLTSPDLVVSPIPLSDIPPYRASSCADRASSFGPSVHRVVYRQIHHRAEDLTL
jgi:hypothetical protein